MGGIMNFRLSTPRRETFLVSVVIAILVIIGMIVRYRSSRPTHSAYC